MIYEGIIVDGMGRHRTLEMPIKLYPGSLNVELDVKRYPDGTKGIDRMMPHFIVKGETIKNNDRGDAKFWRAIIEHKHNKKECWVMKRVHAKAWRQLELMSNECLRKALNLHNFDQVTVQICT